VTDTAHKLPLDAIVARRALPGLMAAAENNWRDFYHNISMLHIDCPAKDTAYEQAQWIIYVKHAFECMKMDVTENLKDKFNEHWTFYQCGRSGATFYPEEPAARTDYSSDNCGPLMDIRNACFEWRNANAALARPDEYELLPPFDINESGYGAEDMADLWVHNYERAKHHRDAFAWINKTVKRHMDGLSGGWAEWKKANKHLFETEDET